MTQIYGLPKILSVEYNVILPIHACNKPKCHNFYLSKKTRGEAVTARTMYTAVDNTLSTQRTAMNYSRTGLPRSEPPTPTPTPTPPHTVHYSGHLAKQLIDQ